VLQPHIFKVAVLASKPTKCNLQNLITLLLHSHQAEYQSENQKMTIQHCLHLTLNLVAVMGIGEGKSMAEQVCARLQPHIKNVVIISLATNLVNQCKQAKDMGFKVHLF
jgi:superfamily II DNA helicase RecQ